MSTERDTAVDVADASECVLVTDSDGTIIWASPGSEVIFEQPRASLTDDATVKRILELASDERALPNEAKSEHEVRVTTADGREYALVVTAIGLGDVEGATMYHCRRAEHHSDRVQTVLSRISDGMVALDTDWRCTFVNEAAESLLERSAEELLGKTIWQEFPTTEDSALRDTLELALETQEPVSIEWYGPETETWFEVRAFPSTTGLSVYFRDVSERKERIAALEYERDLVGQLLSVSPIGIAVHTPDGEFVRLNERAGEILDVDREELLGETLDESMWRAFAPDGTPFPDEAFPFNVVVETGEPTLGTEMSLQRGDGTRIWLSVSAAPLLNEDGKIERVIVVFDDITEQKRYEQDVEESEAKFRSVFEGTLDALILADDEGTYHEVNQAACDLFGRERDELVGLTVADVAPQGYDVAAAWEAFLEQGELRGEFPVARPDGETRIADFAATANVSPGRHLSALRDITERKEAEAKLAAQRDELERVNRINELIRDVNQVVVAATDRDSIETAVCDSLTQSDSFPVAVSSRVGVDGTVTVEQYSGLSSTVLESLRDVDDNLIESAIQTAADTVSPTVVTDIQNEELHSSRIRDIADQLGITAIGNIPVEYDGVVYGVLSICTTHEEEVFSDRELEVFVELGQTLGAAIDAIQTKKLLYASAFLELTLAVTAENAPLIEANELVDGTWTLEGVVPVEAGQYLLYVDIGSGDASAVETAAADIDSIEAIRVVGDGPQEILELRVSEAVPISALLDAGGRMHTATFENGTGEFVVDVTLDTDVRSYLDRVEQTGVAVDLLAKREVERAPAGAWLDTTTDDSLTDRQRAVLEAAYRSGYFHWPRRQTTGEELAGSLDISSSTLHQHLRIATAKVLEQYFSVNALPSE